MNIEELKNTVHLGDCLDIMQQIPDHSVDMVLADLPYGTTQNKWDTPINLSSLWAAYNRICRPAAVIALTAQTPFDKILGASNISNLKYEWIWEKAKATGHLNSKIMPMKAHENILIFYAGGKCIYNPQKWQSFAYKPNGGKSKRDNYGDFDAVREGSADGSRYPRSVQKFTEERKPIHPTQKPLELFEYFIKTYTNEGDTVLDNVAGSGTTGVACQNTGRNYILIEKEQQYFDIINARLSKNV